MLERKGILLTGLVIAVLIAFQPTAVQAHTPESMTLDYDWDTAILTVSVVHHVLDPLTHYIEKIIVYQNSFSNIVETREYENQSSTEGMSDAFWIPADAGDVLSVTAECVVSGALNEDLTVTEPAATDTTGSATTQSQADDRFMTIAVLTGFFTVIVACGAFCAKKAER